MKNGILFLETLSPLHAGSETSLGLVDKPIQREKVTEFPVIFGSSLKGALREFFEKTELNVNENKKKFFDLFGPEDENSESYASAISITDARILLFPVASIKGVYAYITCPFVINRFISEAKLLNIKNLPSKEIDIKINDNEIYVCKGNTHLVINNNVVLTEFQFSSKDSNALDEIFNYLSNNAEVLKEKICILSDDNFKYFVKFNTEVMARVKIGDDGVTDTKKGGNLWYEENIPIYSKFYSIITCFQSRNVSENRTKTDELDKYFNELFKGLNSFVIGGNKTIGKGIVKSKFLGGE